MATRSADIPKDRAVDLTAALSLAVGVTYLIDLGRDLLSGDYALLALGGDPEAEEIGGHPLFFDRGGVLVYQPAGQTWQVRVYSDASAVQMTATEAHA